MDYNQPYGAASGAPYVNGNPASGVAGSIPPAAAIEYPQRELVGLINDCGLVPDNSNLHQVAQAILSGRLNFGVAGGTANAIVLTLPRAPASYSPGLMVLVKLAFFNTGAATINVNGLGAVAILRRDGSPLAPFDIISGSLLPLGFDGAAFRLLAPGAMEIPSNAPGNPTIYIRTDGNDANDGSANDAAHAMATINAAARLASSKYNLTGKVVTLQLGNAGTYAPLNLSNGVLPSFTLRGDPANQDNYIISGTAPGFVSGACSGTLVGIRLYNATATASHTLEASYGASVTLQAVTLSGVTSSATGIAHVVASNNAVVTITGGGNVDFWSNIGIGLFASSGRIICVNGSTIRQIGGANYANAFLVCSGLSSFTASSGAVTFSGAATGVRYAGSQNSIINTGGGGASYLPGSLAGTLTTGAQYL